MTWGALFRRLWFLLRAEWNWHSERWKDRLAFSRIGLGEAASPLQEGWGNASEAGGIVTDYEVTRTFNGPLLRDPHARRSARAVGEMVRQEDPRVTERSRLRYQPLVDPTSWIWLPEKDQFQHRMTGEIRNGRISS